MRRDIEAHHRIVRQEVGSFGGGVFKSLGDGQAAVFETPREAVLAALASQKRLAQELPHLQVRVGVHSGSAERVEGDYMGSAVNRVARITALAAGGQVLVSETTRNLAIDDLGDSVAWTFRGEVLLAGHERPERLHQAVVSGMRCDFPPIRTIRPRHNLTQLDRAFVGRDAERSELNERLAGGQQRLITLLGFGGMGKTTLAHRCALDCIDAFPDGVWWIDCETLSNRDDIVAATLASIQVAPDPRSPEVSLLDSIGNSRTLLILDCFEKIVLHAGLIDTLMKQCPQVQVLVTSRLRLGITWEYEMELRGLQRRSGRKLDADAIALFSEAASHVAPTFKINRSNGIAVSDLVRALEFIPLAVVITAGRLRHLTLREICEQVRASQLDLVSSGGPRADKHASLRTVIGASLSLLPGDLRSMLDSLSVFEGGFFLQDARAVLGQSGDVVDAIGQLRDHSLLQATPTEAGMRFRQLDAVREYIAETVDQETLQEIGQAHAKHYLSVASLANELYSQGAWDRAAKLLWLESGNLRRAIGEANNSGMTDVLCRYAMLLSRAYVENGLVREFDALAEQALVAAQVVGDDPLRLEILGLKGIVALRRGRRDLAESFWLQRAEICEATNDAEGVAESLGDAINLAIEEGSGAKVMALLARYEGLDAELSGAKLHEHMILRARIASFLGNHEVALDLASRVGGQLVDEDPEDWKFYVSRTLSEIYRNAGHYDASLDSARRTLALGLQGRFEHRVGQALVQLSLTLIAAGRRAKAAQVVQALAMIPRSSSQSVIQITERLEGQLFNEMKLLAMDPVEGDWTSHAEAILDTVDPAKERLQSDSKVKT